MLPNRCSSASRVENLSQSSSDDSSAISEPKRLLFSVARKPTRTLDFIRTKAIETLVQPEMGAKKERPTVLRLNIAGQPFSISISTILKRGDIGLLYRFANSGHRKRLLLCDDYNATTDEYYFERSSLLFHPIFLWYINGIRTRIPLYARDNFIAELSFWGLANVFYPNLLKKRQKEQLRELSLAEKFSCVRFGPVREWVWHLCETPDYSPTARCFAICSIFAVVFSIFGLICSSMPEFQIDLGHNGTMSNSNQPHPSLEYIEYVCIVFFTLEFVIKLAACPDRRQFFLNYLNLIDFVAIAPFYLELLGLHSTNAISDPLTVMRVIRMMRVLRIVRLFKLGRYSTGLRVFGEVIWGTLMQMGVVLIVVAIGVMFFATIVYYLEKDREQTRFQSIPITMWWCVVTISTVGYGDMVPETIGGKLLTCAAIGLGVLVLSMPVTIFVDKFIDVQEEEELERTR